MTQPEIEAAHWPGRGEWFGAVEVWVAEETEFEVLTVEVVGSDIWPVGVNEPWIVVQFEPWVGAVTEPEVWAVVVFVPEV